MLKTEVPKLLGLQDERKMSKSLGNHLPMADVCAREELWSKLKPARVDPARVKRTDPGNPDVCNVFTMHKALSPPADQEWAAHGCRAAGIGCMQCKEKLRENMLAHFASYCDKRAELVAHPERVRHVLLAGTAKASAMPKQTLGEVRDRMGLWH